MTRSFDVFFDLRLNKRLSKLSWGWWFDTLSCSLWHHCNACKFSAKTGRKWHSFNNFWEKNRKIVTQRGVVDLGNHWWWHFVRLWVNSSPPGQNVFRFADDIFQWIFLNEKFCISIQISLKFVPQGPIDNNSALVQVMTRHRTGDKPLPKPMRTQFADAYKQR